MALSMGTQIGIGAVVIGTVAFLFLSSPEEGVLEYVYVDAVLADPDNYKDRDFKVHGIVVVDSLEQDEDGDYHFVIESKGKRLQIIYDELLPDTFAEGGEVVLTGHLDDEGTLRTSEMTAKCPSKYEEEQGMPS